MDDQLAVVDPAEIEARSGDRNVVISREEIELAQHRWSGHMQRAPEGRAVCLVRMTGEDADDPIPVTCHDRFQVCRLTHDERRVVVRRSHQPTGVVKNDQITLWRWSTQLGL